MNLKKVFDLVLSQVRFYWVQGSPEWELPTIIFNLFLKKGGILCSLVTWRESTRFSNLGNLEVI